MPHLVRKKEKHDRRRKRHPPSRILPDACHAQLAGKYGIDSSATDSAGRLCSKLYCIRAPMTSVVKHVAASSSMCSQ